MHESCLAQTQRQKHSKKKRLAHKTYTQREVTLTHTKYGQPNFRVFNHFETHVTRNPGICITILVTLEASYSEGDFWDNPIIHGHQHSTNSM